MFCDTHDHSYYISSVLNTCLRYYFLAECLNTDVPSASASVQRFFLLLVMCSQLRSELRALLGVDWVWCCRHGAPRVVSGRVWMRHFVWDSRGLLNASQVSSHQE